MEEEEDPVDLTLTVITELEDKTALEHIIDAKGHSNKTPAPKRHFNDFLALYCEEKKAPVITPDDIPYYLLRSWRHWRVSKLVGRPLRQVLLLCHLLRIQVLR